MGTLVKRPLHEVRPIALDLAERLGPACERIEIAGSIRREAPQVGDIEFVAIPRFERCALGTGQGLLFASRPGRPSAEVNLLWEAVDRLGVAFTKRGPVHRQFTWRSLRVDAYTCQRGNWGWILFHRTGPGYLRQKIGWLLVQNGYAAVDGWIWDAREGKLSIDRIETPEEADVFRLLGIPYLPPRERDRLKQA